MRKLTPQELAIESVNMFLEYRDVHGEEDEEIAKTKASREMEGYEILLDHEVEELHRLREVNADLLAACEAARKAMQNQWHNKPRIGMERECEMIDAAIAKVRGE